MKIIFFLLALFVAVPAFAADECPPGHVRHPAVSPLDHEYMVAAFKASFRGLFGRDPSMIPGSGKDDGEYYIGASNHYGVYGDDQCHAGWSGYWEAWLELGHGDLSLVQTPARFLPNQVPTTPPVVNPPVVIPPQPAPVLDLSSVQVQLTAIIIQQQTDHAILVEHVRADGDAHASINQNVTELRQEARSAWQQIKPFITFVSKYAPIVVGAIYAGRATK